MNQFCTRNRLVDPVIICIFLLALFVPMVTWIAQKDVKFSEVEKRALQPFPAMSEQESITGFTRAFDTYFKDHFGFRNWLIHRHQREVSKRFVMSGITNVIVGLDDWLFLTRDRVFDDLQGRLRFSLNEEQRFWTLLAQKKAWVEQKGIAYIFMVVPNKQSIYPEYHPRFYEKAKKQSRFDHLLAARPEESKGDLLDIRENLKQGKTEARLYHKTDTHWNYRGSYIAYQALMKRIYKLFPDLPPHRDFRFTPAWRDEPSGDLAMMAGLRETMIEKSQGIESSDFTTYQKKFSKELITYFDLRQLQPFHTAKKNTELRVLVLHDSFFNHLRPFMSESFGDVLYVWQYYDASTLEFFNREKLTELIDIYQPDLVIEETVERYLPRFLVTNEDDWSINAD